MSDKLLAAVVGCLLCLLSAPRLCRADDWEQLPADSGESGAETAAPSSGSDAQAIAGFFAQVKAPPAQNQKGCEVIGMFADMMAIARDQGIAHEQLREQITTGFAQKAAEKKLPMKWVRPIQTVVEHQVDYVYAHPELKASQVQTKWTDMCQAEVGGG